MLSTKSRFGSINCLFPNVWKADEFPEKSRKRRKKSDIKKQKEKQTAEPHYGNESKISVNALCVKKKKKMVCVRVLVCGFREMREIQRNHFRH